MNLKSTMHQSNSDSRGVSEVTRWGNGPAAAQPLARYSASEGALARRWSSLTDGVI